VEKMQKLNDRMQKLESMMQHQEQDMEKVRENIEHIDQNLGEATDEFEGVNKKIEDSKQNLSEILSANAEQEDIEAHRNNIILYRTAESCQARAEERLKEDVAFCEKFLHASQVGVDPEDIIKVPRLGKRNTDSGSRRPILIQLGRHVKKLITESLYKIKYLEAKFQGVIVSHDMTKKQREECKALGADAKGKSELGDWVYTLRSPPRHWKIIQIRKRN